MITRFSRALSSAWARVAIALGVVALLLYFQRLEVSALPGLARSWKWLLAALILMLPPFVVGSYRFRLILGSQGIHIPFRQALRLTMIGSFFDLALPSASGGDLVKAGYLLKYVEVGYRTRAVMAIAFDRLLGLVGLFSLAAAASLLGWTMLRDLPSRHLLAGLTVSASVLPLVFLRLAGSGYLRRNRQLGRLLARFAWDERFRKFTTTFNALRERPRYLVKAVGLSVLNHVFWCASLLCIVRAMGNTVDPLRGFVVFPLAIFSNVFGVAGGFGVGTVGFDLLLSQLLAIGNGALVGLVFQTLSALVRLTGLPFYLSAKPGQWLYRAAELQIEGDEL